MRIHITTMILSALALTAAARGQVLVAPFDQHYSISDLGTPPNVLLPLGGLFIRPEEPNTLLLGGAANSASAVIYAVGVVRGGDGHITGFAPGTPPIVSTAPGIGFGGIDGGLAVGPGGVLFYTAYSSNTLGEIKPGSSTPDLLIDMNAQGVASSLGTLAFVPPGFPNAGKLKIASYNGGSWYSVGLTADANGTYTVASVTNPILLRGGPEGILFVEAGNPDFPVNSVLISQYGVGRVVAFELDGNSDPIVSTLRIFLNGVGGAEGAARDPVTGDYLFSTFQGGNKVLVVRGFAVACPADLSGNGSVGPEDLALLLGDWGSAASVADLDGNGIVGASDLGILLGAWGPCP